MGDELPRATSTKPDEGRGAARKGRCVSDEAFDEMFPERSVDYKPAMWVAGEPVPDWARVAER